MMKMRNLMILFVVLALTTSTFGYQFWNNGSGDRDWSNGLNWTSGLAPTSVDDIDITSFNALGPIVGNGDVATALVVPIGAYSPGATVTLDLQPGGWLGGMGWMIVGGRLGHVNTGKGVLNMSGGILDASAAWFAVGNGGVEGEINMTNGNISTTWFGIGRDSDGVSIGHVQLDGGEIVTNTIAMGAQGTLDITAGTLRVGGDVTGIVNPWIAAGKITGYGSNANVVVDTATVPGWTLITAVPEPATMMLLGFGSLVLIRKRKKS